MTRRGRLFMLREMLGFVMAERRVWLIPIVLILVLVAALLAAGALGPLSPFLYPL